MIPSVAATTLQNLHIAGGHAHGWRPGDTIKAQIAAISDDGLTQLMVGDIPLTIRLPVQLRPGTTVMLVVKQSNEHGLVLEMKLPQGDAASTARSALPAVLPLPEANDQTLQNSKLAVGGAVNALLMDLLGRAPVTAAGTPLITQHPGAQIAAAKITSRFAAPGLGSDLVTDDVLLADEAPVTDEKITTAYAAHGNSAAAPTDTANSTSAARANIINFILPGMAEHLEIQVFEDDDQNLRQYVSDDAGRIMTVRFTIASDSFGAVHVILRQAGEAVSVGLWAERADVAAELQRDQSELRDGLHVADVAVETIDIFAGNPPSGPASDHRSTP